MHANNKRFAMCETSEISLALPADLVKKTAGFSIDMGGTMIKVVYRSKENLEEANATNGRIGHMQFVSFPKSEIHRALEYVKERCEISRKEGELTEIRSTGIWFMHWKDKLTEKLGVCLGNLSEFECFYNGFTYLASRFSRKDFLHPYDDDAAVEMVEMMKAQMDVVVSFGCDTNDKDASKSVGPGEDFFTAGRGKVIVEDSDHPIAEVEEIYPCIVAMYGSGFGYMKIDKDKKYRMIDGGESGGSTLYGIGHLLTGCKSFEELIELAEHGDRKNVDVYSDSIHGEGDNGDASFYDSIAKSSHPVPLYYFGKAGPNKPNLRREDVAAAWLHCFAMDRVHCLTLLAEVHQVKRIFVVGSSCNSALMRSVFTTQMVGRNLFNSTLGISTIQFDFVKQASYIGVLGALVSNCI